ncbi:MAG: S-layer homology domain-containing protein [Clostridia bacterium]|nr:S-layer homology domain-containing protein [Clostridia bacterium]
MKRIISTALAVIMLIPAFGLISDAVIHLSFRDVRYGDWYYDTVSRVYNAGIMKGVSATKFDPNGLMTREQAAMIFYNLEAEGERYSNYSFKDIKAGAWYADAVEFCYRHGITKGISTEYFGVGRYITRQDMITMIYRLYRSDWAPADKSKQQLYISKDAVKHFKDYSDIAPYALEAMRFSSGVCMIITLDHGAHINLTPIIQGNNGYVKPRSYCTRAEMATIIYKTWYINQFL